MSAAAHYFWRTSKPRRFLDSGFGSAASYRTKRFKEFTTPLNITVVALLPFLNKFNGRLDARIADERKGQSPPEGAMLEDLVAATTGTAQQVSVVVTRECLQSLVVSALIDKGLAGSKLAASIAQTFDVYNRLLSHYAGKALAAIYLPASWANAVIGVPPTKDELDQFQNPDVDASAVLQDSLKRQGVIHTAATLTASIRVVGSRVGLPWLGAGGKPAALRCLSALWIALPVKLAGGAVFAVVGRRLFGPGWELLFELIGEGVAYRLAANQFPMLSLASGY